MDGVGVMNARAVIKPVTNQEKHMNKMVKSSKFTKLIKDKRGATMVEYAILLFLILVLAAIVYKSLGSSVSGAGGSAVTQFT